MLALTLSQLERIQEWYAFFYHESGEIRSALDYEVEDQILDEVNRLKGK